MPPGTNAFAAMRTIAAADGVAGLFVGVQARLLMSALFGGVGFASFELVKQRLGVGTGTATLEPQKAVATRTVATHCRGHHGAPQ